jgi:CheY-like chemotaxis protein
MKTLIVEDELIIARVLEHNLKSLGFSVLGTVRDGKTALEKVKSDSPDLIFMDIMIEGDWDGVETYRKIREISDAQVVYVTANSDPYFRGRAHALGCLAFLVKPVERSAIQSLFYPEQAEN